MSPNDRYLHGHHESVLQSHEWRTAENSAAYLLDHLTVGAHVLDVGSGPGTITVDIAERVFPGTVTGLDVAPEMKARAEAYAESRGCQNAQFRVGDAYNIDAEDGSYDIVHAHQVLQHLANPAAALGEMMRVLKPGGILAVRDVIYSSTSWSPENDGLRLWLKIYLAAAHYSGGDPDIGRRLHALAIEAGASSVVSSASAWCFSTPSERDWWGTSWATRATESGFTHNALESGEARVEDLERIADAWRQWAADDRGWLAMMHGEIIARAPGDHRDGRPVQ